MPTTKKQIRVIYNPTEFEAFVNSPDVDVITMSIQACEQTALAQYGFIAVVYYKVIDLTKSKDVVRGFYNVYPGLAGLSGPYETKEKAIQEKSNSCLGQIYIDAEIQ